MPALLKKEGVEMSGLPPRKIWTHEEYYRLHEIGMLPERCELINGEIILKMPQNPPHIHILFFIAKWLRQIFGYDYVNTQVPVTLTDADGRPSNPEPDVVVVSKPVLNFYPLRVQAADALLVVEVSVSTLEYNQEVKADVYAAGGITEYWILDVEARRVFLHRNPTPNGYSLLTIAGEQEQVGPQSRPDAKIRVGDLFPLAAPETEN
jgi:Uma2 family endonuclease